MTNPANWGGEERLTTSSFHLEQAPNIEGQTLSGYFLGDDQGLATQAETGSSRSSPWPGPTDRGPRALTSTGPTHLGR